MFIQNCYCYYFLGSYTKYFPVDIYTLLNLQVYTEMASLLVLSFVLTSSNVNHLNTTLYTFCVLCFFLLLWVDLESYPLLLVISVLCIRGGVSCCFCISYMMIPLYFLPVQRTSAYGITNVLSRVATLFPSMVAELSDPIPMLVCFVISCLGLVGAGWMLWKK